MELKNRLVVGGAVVTLVGICIFLSTLSWGWCFFGIALAALVAIALWEYFQLAKVKGLSPPVATSIIGSSLYILIMTLVGVPSVLPTFVLAATLGIIIVQYFFSGEKPFINIAIAFFGICYITVPLSLIIKITYFFPPNSLYNGTLWLVYLLVVTKMGDVGGFLVGTKWGKRKLAPKISPAKTIEGLMGGIIGSALASVVLALLFDGTPFVALGISVWAALILGALIAVVGQFGDLAESLLKRDAGVKDSNRLPGLGGVLDMVDSLLFTAPLIYFFMCIRFQGVT